MGKPSQQALFNKHLSSIQLVIMGITQIVAGVLAIIFNIFAIEVSAELSTVGIGFWGGILYISSGVIGIITSKIKTSPLVITCAVITTVAGVVAFLMLVLCSIGFFTDSLSATKQSQVASNVILAIIALVELFGAIWQSCLCYLVLCCMPHYQQQDSSSNISPPQHNNAQHKPHRANNYHREATSITSERETDTRSKSADSQTHILPSKDARTNANKDTRTDGTDTQTSPTDRQSPPEYIGMANRRPQTAKPSDKARDQETSKKPVEAVDEEMMAPLAASGDDMDTGVPSTPAPSSLPPTPSPAKSTRRDSTQSTVKRRDSTSSPGKRRDSSSSPVKSKTPAPPSAPPTPSSTTSSKRDSSTGPSVARHT